MIKKYFLTLIIGAFTYSHASGNAGSVVQSPADGSVVQPQVQPPPADPTPPPVDIGGGAGKGGAKIPVITPQQIAQKECLQKLPLIYAENLQSNACRGGVVPSNMNCDKGNTVVPFSVKFDSKVLEGICNILTGTPKTSLSINNKTLSSKKDMAYLLGIEVYNKILEAITSKTKF